MGIGRGLAKQAAWELEGALVPLKRNVDCCYDADDSSNCCESHEEVYTCPQPIFWENDEIPSGYVEL